MESSPRLSILDVPIDWSKDETKKPVPESARIEAEIETRWRAINASIYDGKMVDLDIRFAEEAILKRKDLIDRGELDGSFDWKHDLELARHCHIFHLKSIDHQRRKRADYIEYWRSVTRDATSFYREVSLNGQKTIMLLHGAVALGALNILSDSSKSASLNYTARFAIVCAAIGIISAGAGQLIMFYFSAATFSKIRGRLHTEHVRWSKVRALGRYFAKSYQYIRLGERLMYGSIFWFGVYLILLMLILVCMP